MKNHNIEKIGLGAEVVEGFGNNYDFKYDELKTKSSKLIASTSEKLTSETERNFNNVNMFYNIYQNHKPSELFSQKTNKTGIKFLKLSISTNSFILLAK